MMIAQLYVFLVMLITLLGEEYGCRDFGLAISGLQHGVYLVWYSLPTGQGIPR